MNVLSFIKSLIVFASIIFSSITQIYPAQWDNTNESRFESIINNTRNYSVFTSNTEIGTYSHHPAIENYHGKLFASWSHGRKDEDSPGQYIMGSISLNGTIWSKPFTIFPSMDVMKDRDGAGTPGRVLTALTFLEVENNLYSIAEVFDWKLNSSGSYEIKGYGRIARNINEDGTMGNIFWIEDNPPAAISGFPTYPDSKNEQYRDVAKKINDRLNDPLNIQPWDFKNYKGDFKTDDGGTTVETTFSYYRNSDNTDIRFGRDSKAGLKLYYQISTNKGISWSDPIKSNIPDSTTKSVVGTLPDGKVFLIGTQISSLWKRDNLTLSISSDGVTFKPVGSIRNDFVPQKYTGKYKGEVGKSAGFAYPSYTITDHTLWVIYSVGKEDISVSKIPLTSLQ